MEKYRLEPGPAGRPHVRVPHRGHALINHPMYNKGSAFTSAEREAFGLTGMLPAEVGDMAEQLKRIYANIRRKSEPIEQYIGLAALQDRNEVLFHRLMVEHVEEFLPVVYTPTVGQACQQFSHLYRRPRGLWITPEHKGRIDEVLSHAPFEDVRLIVVTDGERILGLGDQGAGGMGIPVGKLIMYTVAAGIHPAQTLPICIDVGTDNQGLLHDDLYLGVRQPRLRGPAYDELIEEFVFAVKHRFPRVMLQWEDFKKQNAFDLLDRYRQVLPSFNDDIQGTAAVAAAGILAAGRLTKTPTREQRVMIMGGGAAGLGIARLLRDVMHREGLAGDDLQHAIAVLDSQGLLIEGRAMREPSKKEFAWPTKLAERCGLKPSGALDAMAVMAAYKPTVLIGTTGEPGTFTEPLIRLMASNVQRPAVFPFSNPNSKAEARPEDVVRWTDGRAVIATGSPFAPVEHAGKVHRFAQGNNVYIFPAVGLAAVVGEASIITDGMFAAAAAALAEQVSEAQLAQGLLYPPVCDIRKVTAVVAEAVFRRARDEGVARHVPDEQVPALVRGGMWHPEYPDMTPA